MWLLSQLCNQLLMNVFHCSTNTDTGACHDVRAQEFRGIYHQQTYFDIRVFNPLATSNHRLHVLDPVIMRN